MILENRATRDSRYISLCLFGISFVRLHSRLHVFRLNAESGRSTLLLVNEIGLFSFQKPKRKFIRKRFFAVKRVRDSRHNSLCSRGSSKTDKPSSLNTFLIECYSLVWLLVSGITILTWAERNCLEICRKKYFSCDTE